MDALSSGVLSGVGQTFLVAAVGLVGRLLGVITEETLRHLTRVTIALLLPCFLFEAVLREFSWGQAPEYASMILAAVTLLGVGLALAWAGARALRLDQRDRHTAMALGGFNNTVNIPIPLALALFAGNDAGRLVVFFTLYNLVWSPFIWSFGVWLVAPHGGADRPWWRAALNPPGLAILAGVVAHLPGVHSVVGHGHLGVLHKALAWTGEAAIPCALLILGGILGGLLRGVKFHWRVIGLTIVVKLFALPALTWVVVRLIPGLDPLVAIALMIQAASPPATNLIIISKHFGGDTDTIGATLMITYLLSIATFALWLSLMPFP